MSEQMALVPVPLLRETHEMLGLATRFHRDETSSIEAARVLVQLEGLSVVTLDEHGQIVKDEEPTASEPTNVAPTADEDDES